MSKLRQALLKTQDKPAGPHPSVRSADAAFDSTDAEQAQRMSQMDRPTNEPLVHPCDESDLASAGSLPSDDLLAAGFDSRYMEEYSHDEQSHREIARSRIAGHGDDQHEPTEDGSPRSFLQSIRLIDEVAAIDSNEDQPHSQADQPVEIDSHDSPHAASLPSSASVYDHVNDAAIGETESAAPVETVDEQLAAIVQKYENHSDLSSVDHQTFLEPANGESGAENELDSGPGDDTATRPANSQAYDSGYRSQSGTGTTDITTEGVCIDDPVATANRLTGWYDDESTVGEAIADHPGDDEQPAAMPQEMPPSLATTARREPVPQRQQQDDYAQAARAFPSLAAETVAQGVDPGAIVATDDAIDQANTLDEHAGYETIHEPQTAAPSVSSTQWELGILANLRDQQIRNQYSQIWDAMRRGKSQSPMIYAIAGCEHEPHVSTVIGHLAQLIANKDQLQVLIVDANRRDRRITREFEAEREKGLSEALLIQCDWTEAVLPTTNRGVCVLPVGQESIEPGEYDPFRLPTMMKSWKEAFDVILVDADIATEPVSQPIFRSCDESYLIVRLGKTTRKLADETIQGMIDQENNLQGTIVTNYW